MELLQNSVIGYKTFFQFIDKRLDKQAAFLCEAINHRIVKFFKQITMMCIEFACACSANWWSRNQVNSHVLVCTASMQHFNIVFISLSKRVFLCYCILSTQYSVKDTVNIVTGS